MEIQAAKFHSLQTKLALAIIIIRNKPKNISTKDYLNLINGTFVKSHYKSSQIIKNLKRALLESKIELFQLKNNNEQPTKLEQVEFKLTNSVAKECLFLKENDESKMSIDDDNDDETVRNNLFYLNKKESIEDQLKINIDFMVNIVKLKSLKKDFRLNEIDNEEIFDILASVVKQTSFFLLNEKFEAEIMQFPYESFMHGIQQFLNIFEIEWFYFMRNNLMYLMTKFIDDITMAILKFSYKRKDKQGTDHINALSIILFLLSTSDYLLNHVLTTSVKGLNQVVELALNEITLDPSKSEDLDVINLFDNCRFILDAIISIVKIRQLNNYTPLSGQIKSITKDLLNNLFIKLTDVFSPMAIHLSKVIQLLTL